MNIQCGRARGDGREAVRPVMTAPRNDPDLAGIDVYGEAISIPFNFKEPISAGWDGWLEQS